MLRQMGKDFIIFACRIGNTETLYFIRRIGVYTFVAWTNNKVVLFHLLSFNNLPTWKAGTSQFNSKLTNFASLIWRQQLWKLVRVSTTPTKYRQVHFKGIEP